MPRSKDGRWERPCKLCGKPFSAPSRSSEFCSQKCSNKAIPGRGGRMAAAGVPERDCEVCGIRFQPYRAKQTTCSRACYYKHPVVHERELAARRTDGARARKNQWRKLSPDQQAKIIAYNRKNQLAKYGLTVDDYDRMLAEQGGVCKLCGQPPNPEGIRASSKLHADHDHESGVVRDLLCTTCNRGLGYFKDDPVLLRAAAEYIERHRSLP